MLGKTAQIEIEVRTRGVGWVTLVAWLVRLLNGRVPCRWIVALCSVLLRRLRVEYRLFGDRAWQRVDYRIDVEALLCA